MRKPKHLPNKGSKIQMLPSRSALNTLTGGNPIDRSLNNYAKLTPSGRSAFGKRYANIQEMGLKGIKIPD